MTGTEDKACGNQKHLHAYCAFGLIFRSEVALPELTEVSLDPDTAYDVDIVLNSAGRSLPDLDDGLIFDLHQEGDHYMAWPDVAAFRIRGTTRIEVQPYPNAPLAYLAFPLLGPVLGFLLHLRGQLVLHGSGVDVNGRAALFVGDKMAGKSTTAAAFIKNGHSLLTDDLLAIDLSNPNAPKVLPAFSQLKLSDEASDAIALPDAEKLPLVFEGFAKHQHRLAGSFSHQDVPVGHIYVLNRIPDADSAPKLNAVRGVAALQAIARFAYVGRFGRAAFPEGAQASHLQRCAILASKCKVWQLDVPASLERIDEVVSLVRRDFQAP